MLDLSKYKEAIMNAAWDSDVSVIWHGCRRHQKHSRFSYACIRSLVCLWECEECEEDFHVDNYKHVKR